MQHHGEQRILQISCESGSAQGLARARRSGEQDTSAWLKPFFFQFFAHASFNDEMRQFAFNFRRQDHIAQALTWIGSGKEPGEIASRRGDRRDSWRPLCRGALPGFGPVSKLLGQTRVTLLLFGRRELHRQIVEPIGVPFCVALDEADELLGGCHG